MPNERVPLLVPVSAPMRSLRDVQTRLNAMLWSSEICYGHVLNGGIDADQPVQALFAHVETQAWTKNVKGLVKYRKSGHAFLRDVARNLDLMHRQVMVSYYAAFEAYLAARLGVRNGPFVRTLADLPALRTDLRPRGETVVLADACRLLRNRLAHHGKLPRREDDDQTADMCASFQPKNQAAAAQTEAALASWRLTQERVAAIVRTLIADVDRRCGATRRRSALRHEFFYTLFAFTHLDNLAFEIEEAAFDPARATLWIARDAKRVRSPEMRSRATTPPAPRPAPS
ncbi:MAG TPA: hypothetical protein PKA55_19900 [Rhodoblastus sp.]|nr:hypothetical protein [Rhodoblastus sp.]